MTYKAHMLSFFGDRSSHPILERLFNFLLLASFGHLPRLVHPSSSMHARA